MKKSEGIAIYDLEDDLELARHDPELKKAIEQLKRSGKIRTCIGRSKDGMLCNVVQIIDNEPSKRDLLGDRLGDF